MSQSSQQFATFVVADRLYGIDVMKVQEILKEQPLTPVPLAPGFVQGLINLRGQIATAIGLRNFFKLPQGDGGKKMNVVCLADGTLISLVVDDIGDVMEVSEQQFEDAPDTIPESIKNFMTGVYKTSGNLLSVLDISKIIKSLNE